MHFLVKNKIPRLHSGVSNAARFLSQSLRFNSFLLRIQYTKLQYCSFETARTQRAIHNYLNKSFVNDKLLKVLVKYHSINNSIATRERRIDRPQKPLPLLSLSSNEEFPLANHIQYTIRCKVVRQDMSIIRLIYLRRQKNHSQQNLIYTT